MTARWFGERLAMFGVALAISTPITFHAAEAAWARSNHYGSASTSAIHAGIARAHTRYAHYGRSAARFGGGALQCVPFARENTGIELSGNANTWWNNAEGVYERGARPEVGSVLNFRATGRMRWGHVAVVTNVVNSRRIEIDHANWGGPGRVSRDIDVVDVSPENDWTAVRVALDRSEEFGSVYPTYGFIYDRPDHGTMLANTGVTPTPVLNPAPDDLRPASERMETAAAATEPEEVAEAADEPAPRTGRHWAGRHARSRSVHARAHTAPRATYRVSSRSNGLVSPHSRRRQF
jgi:surface antigen